MTHRDYFRRYQLNVAQYGEILIADAFSGRKMGDAQKGYDVVVEKEKLTAVLHGGGIAIERILPKDFEGPVLIEVKSKQATGASVIHCTENKVTRMTHFAVILVDTDGRNGGDPKSTNDGAIRSAWLTTCERAKILRMREGVEQFISPSQLRTDTSTGGTVDITAILNRVADAPLS